MMSYKFVKGVPCLKCKSELPQWDLLIPQPDGSLVPIEWKEVMLPTEMIGFWATPTRDRSEQVKAMVVKGMLSVDHLKSGYLS